MRFAVLRQRERKWKPEESLGWHFSQPTPTFKKNFKMHAPFFFFFFKKFWYFPPDFLKASWPVELHGICIFYLLMPTKKFFLSALVTFFIFQVGTLYFIFINSTRLFSFPISVSWYKSVVPTFSFWRVPLDCYKGFINSYE